MHTMDMTDAWDFEEVYGLLHQFAADYPFDTDRNEYLVNITTGTHVAQICCFLLTETRHFPARLLQLSPRKVPIGTHSVIDLDITKYNRLASRFEKEHDDAIASLKGGIETRSASFNRLIERIEHVAARTTDPMLLTGPTGVGKNRLASRIYALRRHKHMVEGPLVEVNCATLRGDSAMSTLFGHRKAAFTGANNDRAGLLMSAHTGMLFLDEIGELGLDEQAMLLRAIEEGRFLPMGSDREVTSAFQLIAGTNRDLPERVRAGAFREDLLARMNLWTFHMPALRERHEDIEPNVAYELERYAQVTGNRVRFSPGAREYFLTFAYSAEALWSGNFRDLVAAITRMATLAPGGRISTSVVDEETARLKANWGVGPSISCVPRCMDTIPLECIESLDLFDRVQLERVVEVCRASASLSDAGPTLFAVSRTTRSSVNDSDRLRKYLAKFGLDWNTIQSSRAEAYEGTML